MKKWQMTRLITRLHCKPPGHASAGYSGETRVSIHAASAVLILACLAGCAARTAPQILRYRAIDTTWPVPQEYAACERRDVRLASGEAVRFSCAFDLVYLDKDTRRVIWKGDSW